MRNWAGLLSFLLVVSLTACDKIQLPAGVPFGGGQAAATPGPTVTVNPSSPTPSPLKLTIKIPSEKIFVPTPMSKTSVTADFLTMKGTERVGSNLVVTVSGGPDPEPKEVQIKTGDDNGMAKLLLDNLGVGNYKIRGVADIVAVEEVFFDIVSEEVATATATPVPAATSTPVAVASTATPVPPTPIPSAPEDPTPTPVRKMNGPNAGVDFKVNPLEGFLIWLGDRMRGR